METAHGMSTDKRPSDQRWYVEGRVAVEPGKDSGSRELVNRAMLVNHPPKRAKGRIAFVSETTLFFWNALQLEHA